MKTSKKIIELSPDKKHEIVVVLHLFYPELFDEIRSYLDNLKDGFDLYISLPIEQAEFERTIRSFYPDSIIYLCENRGRDLAPFIVFLNIITALDYKYLLKVHTKKTLHREDGSFWRKDVFHKLLGSSLQVESIVQAFDDDLNLAMIGPEEHVLDSRFYMGKNKEKIQQLLYKSGFAKSIPESFLFVASTMFWARPEVFKPLQRAKLSNEDFEKEPLPNDGGLAHAMERFLGLLVSIQGKKISTIDEHGQIQDPDPYTLYNFATAPAHLYLRDIHKIVYFPAYQDAYAIEHLRITAPLRAAGIKLISGVVNGVADPNLVFQGDAVIFQREFPKNIQLYEQIVERARMADKFIIYELDDLLFDLPETRPHNGSEYYITALMPMMAALIDADLVIVTTQELRKVVSSYNENVVVLPNYLDDRIWSFSPPGKDLENLPIKIGFIDNKSYTEDLATIAPVLTKLLDRYSDRINVEVWGTPLPPELENNDQITWFPSPSKTYTEFVSFFNTLHFDIVVAPLIDNLFNRCRSGIKFLEYSAIGAPGVYSDLAPYQTLVNDGVNGFLASNRDEWLEKLGQLIEHPELRKQMALAAQKTVKENWLLSENIKSWLDIFDRLNRSVYLEDSQKPMRAHLANMINRKLFYQRTNETQHYQNEIAARDRTLNEIYRSRGWKVLTKYRQGRDKLSGGVQTIKRIIEPVAHLIPGRFAKEMKILLNSGLFDSDYYLRTNPDVRNAGANPLLHYLRFGGIEGRDPSEAFDAVAYLDENEDVRQAGMNPLLHYLQFGKQEGRRIEAVGQREVLEVAASSKASQTHEVTRLVPDVPLLAQQIKQLLSEKLKPTYQIALSHDNYLTITGGTQAYIADEQRVANRKGESHLHIYPFRKRNNLISDDSPLYLGLNLDGEEFIETEANELLTALKELQTNCLSKLMIHHSMGFSERFLQKILNLADSKAIFWLHDYFSLCPSYNLRRNDVDYCGAPDINSNACNLCSYIKARKEHLPVFERLFEKNDFQIATPSQFTYDLWQSRFPVQVKATVIPPAKLWWNLNSTNRYSGGVLRVAFPGYPLDYKGWPVWLRLSEALHENKDFKFFHFSNRQGEEGYYKRIDVTVTKEYRNAMIDSLKWNQMDVALLWSTVAETFSFTLYEALAAGCFILTNPKSGNIQDYIKRNPKRGMIFEDEDALLEAFESGEIVERVKTYQKDGKPQAKLIYGSLEEKN